MMCDMCGKTAELFRTEVEGTILQVCSECAKFGKVISRVRPIEVKKKKIEEKFREQGVMELIVEDYARKIKGGREKLKLKQVEFAKKISEKESLIQHIESGKSKPSIQLAGKLERFLRIRLIEEYVEKESNKSKVSSKEVTIGDIIKIKRRNSTQSQP